MQRISKPARWKRPASIALGSLCVGVGTIGIFVPGLPTTVFLLAASGLFARSSPRLHRWLHAQPRLAAFLHQTRHRNMSLRARLVSVAAMWIGIALALLAGGIQSTIGTAGLLVAGAAGTAAILWFGNRRQPKRPVVPPRARLAHTTTPRPASPAAVASSRS